MDANPTLDQLQVFLAVASEGSFTAAARKLNRAQSVVSYTIANLEAQLGLRLFEREGTRHPRLTDSGAAILADARRIVAGLQLLRARSASLGRGIEGELAIAVDVLVPLPALTRVLTAFRSAFPAVAVRMHGGALGTVWELVGKREVDIGFAGTAAGYDTSGMIVRRIGRMPFVPVAAPDHPLAKAAPPVPSALVREETQIVVTDPTTQTRGMSFGVHAFDIWRVTDAFTKRALIVDGLGWGGLPEWMVETELAAGTLVALDLEPFPRAEYPLCVIRPADMAIGPAASWLVDRFECELAAFCPTSER